MDRGHREYLLVDGYNIINAWPELVEEAKEVDLASARDKLIDIMADYSAFTGICVILVFDAHQANKNMRTSYIINGVEVIYTRSGETADHYIERIADALGKQEKIRVATSDWIEQQIVMGRGAARISARELHEEVKSVRAKRQRIIKNVPENGQTLADIIDPDLKERLGKQIKGEN